MLLGLGNLLGFRNITHLVSFFFFSGSTIIVMKVISVNSKWKCLEGTLELLECFLSSPLPITFISELSKAELYTPRNFQKKTSLRTGNATLRVTLVFNILLIKSQL